MANLWHMCQKRQGKPLCVVHGIWGGAGCTALDRAESREAGQVGSTGEGAEQQIRQKEIRMAL